MIEARRCTEGDSARTHRDERARLIHATSGVVTVSAANRRWTVTSSESLWIPAGVPHEISTYSRMQLCFVTFDPDEAASLPGSPSRLTVTPLIREVVRRLIGAWRGGRGPTARRLGDVLAEELRRGASGPSIAALPADHPLHALCAAFVEDPGSRASADDWAARFGMSRKTLSRSFRLELQTTFGAWQRSVRVDVARRRLAMGETVTKIAYDLGYESLSAFTAMFRRTAGVPPSKALRALSS